MQHKEPEEARLMGLWSYDKIISFWLVSCEHSPSIFNLLLTSGHITSYLKKNNEIILLQ